MAGVTRSRLAPVLLVAAGGTIGTAARLGLGLVIPESDGLPVPILVANLLGAFCLGLVAARLPGSSGMRLFLGTGLLGGFTTYSAFTVGTITLAETAPWLAAAYAVGSVILGIAAAAAGLRIARPRRGRA